MDETAKYEPMPAGIVFEIEVDAQWVTARVSIDALTSLDGDVVDVHGDIASLAAYQRHWAEIHQAAARKVREGDRSPFLRAADF